MDGAGGFPRFRFRRKFRVGFSCGKAGSILTVLVEQFGHLLEGSPAPFFLFSQCFLLVGAYLVALHFRIFRRGHLHVESLALFLSAFSFSDGLNTSRRNPAHSRQKNG